MGKEIEKHLKEKIKQLESTIRKLMKVALVHSNRLDDLEIEKIEEEDKLDELLDNQRIIMDALRIHKVGIEVNTKVLRRKRPPIPKNVSLNHDERKVAQAIYESGEEGILVNKISRLTKLSQVPKIITILMAVKQIPIQNDGKKYRFDRYVAEVQAKSDFLGLSKKR